MPGKRASLQAQLDALVGRFNASEERANASEERANVFEKRANVFEKRANTLAGELHSLKEENNLAFKASREHARGVAHAQMLNTFLNIIKFAQEQEPNPKKRRNSKQFQRLGSVPSMQLFLKVIYPGRIMSLKDAFKFFQDVDSFKDRRDRLMHPRNTADLQDEASRFAAMLADHKRRGDALDAKELLFLDVFSKIDELCASCIGNLQAPK